MRRLHLGPVVALLLASSSCTPQQRAMVADGLTAVSRGSSWLAAAIDAGESGAERYFARHPSEERQRSVGTAIHRAKLAQEALAGLLAAAEALDDNRLTYAREKALDAYAAMYALLSELGVLEARAPDGGAEAEGAPTPLPFALPKPEELQARL